MFARVAVGRRAEQQAFLAEAQSPRVVVGAAKVFELRPVRPEPEEASPKPLLLAPHLAMESRVAHDAVDPAVEAPGEIAWTGMRVTDAPAVKEHLAGVGPSVAVGVLEREHMRCLRHDQAAVMRQHACGDGKLFGENLPPVGPAIAVGVGEHDDPIVPLTLPRLDQVVWVVNALGNEQPAIGIERLRQWLAHQERLRREELDPKSHGRDRVLARRFGIERILHLRERLVLVRRVVAGRRIKRHLRRLGGKGLEANGRLRHRGMVDVWARDRRIEAGGKPDAPLHEVVEPGMRPGPLVVPPGRIEDPPLPFGANPSPRFAVLPLDTFLEDGPAAVVVLRVDVGLVEAFEAAEALHDRMVWRDVHGAKLADSMLLELGPHEVDPGGRIAETEARAVQGNEAFPVADKLEDRPLPVGRKRIDVRVDRQRVVLAKHPGIEVFEPVGVDQFNATRRQHRLELREALRGLVVASVAEKEHPDRRLGRRGLDGRVGTEGCRRHHGQRRDDEKPDGEASHDRAPVVAGSHPRYEEKVHSGSFMIAPPLRADSCASRPVQVQLALCRALG